MMRHRIFSALLAPALCAVAATPAAADPAKAALVIGNGTYEGGQRLPACVKAARDLGSWLEHQGFEVDQVLDGSSVAIRSAIGNFVTRVSGEPQKTAIAYICTYAATSNERLFMLPVDTDPRQPSRLETQGIIVKALLNSLAGTNGVLFAELGTRPNSAVADAVDALQSELPEGVHFAVVARDDHRIGALGEGLPALLSSAGQDWGKLSAAFQTEHGPSQGDQLAVFAPPAGPMPPLAPANAPPLTAPGSGPAALKPQPATTPVAAAAATSGQPVTSLAPAAPAPASPAPSQNSQAATAAATTSAPVPLQPVPTHPSVAASPVGGAAAPSEANQLAPEAPAVARQKVTVKPERSFVRAHATSGADPRASRIQVALARRGFYVGPISGQLDYRTKQAIRAFQTTLGDPPDGELTQIEIARLLNLGQ